MVRFSAQRGRLLSKVGLAILVVALAGGGYGLYSHRPASKENGDKMHDKPITVGGAYVMVEDAPLSLTALGTVNSTYTVTVRSRVDGQLEKVLFTEGQMVKQGQLLAELDARPFQAALAQAQGQYQRDLALLKNAQLDLARYRQLWEQNSIAKQQVDTQQALVSQYEGTVKLDQGLVDNAKLQLEYSRITAPFSGRAGLRLVDPGNMVRSSDTTGLVTLTQTEPINVVFAIPEVSLSAVLSAAQKDPALKVEAWDRDNRNRLAEGSLLAIDNQLNTGTGTITLKARFDNTQHTLFPNQFVNVKLRLGTRNQALTIPSVAIQNGRVGAYVYSTQDGETAHLTPITPGPVFGERTIVESGLSAGQKIVVDGLDKLRDGGPIKWIDRASAAQEQATAAPGPEGGAHKKHKEKPAEGASSAQTGAPAAPAATGS